MGGSDVACYDHPLQVTAQQAAQVHHPGTLCETVNAQPGSDQIALKERPAEDGIGLSNQTVGPSSGNRGTVSFVCCNPCCLAAARGGQVLQVAVHIAGMHNSSSAAGGSVGVEHVKHVRLLVFQHNSLLLDQQVPVEDTIRCGFIAECVSHTCQLQALLLC
jgi:hypothetical protein